MNAKVSAYNERIEALQAFAKGKSAIVGMVTSGGFNVTGNSGRCSIIGNEIGFANVGVDKESEDASHGNLSSLNTFCRRIRSTFLLWIEMPLQVALLLRQK